MTDLRRSARNLLLPIIFSLLILSDSEAAVGKVIAVEGKGYLEEIEGNLVLHLSGTPYQMGYQHGRLLKEHIKDNVENVLCDVGVYELLVKGEWLLSEIENAGKRTSPFIPGRYEEEMKGVSDGSGIPLRDIRYANIFPELFHCSGFAVFGSATKEGRIYHGRILDYMTLIGLQDNAVVIVSSPAGCNAFVNVSFAGFIGSVTGMNDKGISIGEMGGRGEGKWDGMPMSFLLRKALEDASSLSEAVRIFQETPRTCEYYYVISDAKIPDARGIYAVPEKIEIVKPGEYHPQLTEPVEDAVIFSAGERYKKLVEKIKTGYGRIDEEGAIRLMDRPVAMRGNLHSVLFAPETLDFWVAVAGSNGQPACERRYTKYNLKELLK